MASVKNGSVWLGELDRFGYTLRVVGATEAEARDALSKEYIKSYKQINGSSPKKDRNGWGDTYYDSAMNDISVMELEFGEVDWT